MDYIMDDAGKTDNGDNNNYFGYYVALQCGVSYSSNPFRSLRFCVLSFVAVLVLVVVAALFCRVQSLTKDDVSE